MGITGLGHTGLWVHELDAMVGFYSGLLGLQITDRDDELGIVFLSSRPQEEHHEFVLQRGRDLPSGAQLVHQVSWRVDSLDTLIGFLRRFRETGVPVQQVVTHGNAWGIYFFDPEGNRNEVYLKVDREVPQPFRKTLDLDQDVEAITAEAEALLGDDGPAYRPVA